MQEMVVQRSKESKSSKKKNQICKLGGLAIIHNKT